MTLRRPRRNNKETLEKLEKLLDDFRKVEKSFRKLRQRDEKKLLLAELDACIFDQRRHEISDPYYRSPVWDRLRNYKQQKRQHKKEMRGISQIAAGAVPPGMGQLVGGAGSALSPGSEFSAGVNPSDLGFFLKKLSSEVGNLELLLKYPWESEISLLSYYYYGSLQPSSSVFAPLRSSAGVTDAESAPNGGEEELSPDNKALLSADVAAGRQEHHPLTPALCRMAIPNYVLSIYKNGVDLARLESLQSLRTPCRPHRLVRRRGRGGRVWFDRHSLFQENFEPHFTDPDRLDLGSNCGGSGQFMLGSYFRKTASMCDLVDRLCTEGSFDSFGNDSYGVSAPNDLAKATGPRLSGSVGAPGIGVPAPTASSSSEAHGAVGLNAPTSGTARHSRNPSYMEAEMAC
ncbi:Enhancer of polycomb-like protein [Cryptosporidium felis]|nr:Enhancer of polycomb-like protein [Cryptosporidium felis]